jgi:3-oxoacyl-[acyl-carrier-protein] synthase-3
MSAKISEIAYYLPENILTNESLETLSPPWSAKEIWEKVGIKQRHIAGKDETALDLAVKACEKLLTDQNKLRIDFIILCTQSPDYLIPSTACLLQNRLGLKTTVGAFDFNLGCSGYIYGLALAKGLIKSGISSCILLVMAETYSKHIHCHDKANLTIFGDAAAATIVELSEKDKIGEFILGTDGKGWNRLIARRGGIKNMIMCSSSDESNKKNGNTTSEYLYMDGPEIFNFTIKEVPSLVNETLKKNELSLQTVDYVIFHQANKFILDYLRKKMDIPLNKFYLDMEYTGNTVSSTIPIALKNAMDAKKIQEGSKVLLTGFGVGYSWGAVVIEL